MKLQEKAFLLMLINGSYRNNMSWFVSHLVVALISLSVWTWIGFNISGYVLEYIIAAMFVSFELFVFLFYYFHGPRFPWTIRERELQALREWQDMNFEELLNSKVFQKYLKV